MSNKRFRIKKNNDKKEKKGKKTILNRDYLYEQYNKRINKPVYDDLVLVILGGEFGVITEYILEHFSYTGIIVIEPNPQFYSNEKAIDNYLNLTKKHPEVKYITVPNIEKNPKTLLELFLKSNVFGKGMEIIYNPVYEDYYPEKMIQEKEKLENFITTIKSNNKGLDSSIIQNTQSNLNISPILLKDLFQIDDQESLANTFQKHNADTGDGSMVVLIGGEYGYYAKYLLENHLIHNLFIIEPLEEMTQNKIAQSLAKSITVNNERTINVYYFSNGEPEYLRFFEKTKDKLTYIKNTRIIINPLYETNYSTEAKKCVSIVTKYLKDTAFLKGNSTADDLYGMTNSLYNLNNIEKMKDIVDPPKFDTVISVAAGPSLDRHMEELKELAQKFPVVAVEVVANKLVKEGIIPDIVCSQERVFIVSKIVNNFSDEIKKQSIFVAPALIHPFALQSLENYMIFSQPKKSPLESYLAKTYYEFSPKYRQSLYAGEVDILTALQFHPKEVLLFGHDLALEKDKGHADDVIATPQRMEGVINEIGNRGQEVLINHIFQKFRNNTEVLLANIKQEEDVSFITFSDGSKVKYIENSTPEIFQSLLTKEKIKKPLLDYFQNKTIDKEKILTMLNSEIEHLEKQLYFLNHLETFSKFTIIAKFVEFFIKTEKISTGVARLLLDEFLSKHMYVQENMEKWVIEKKDDFLALYKMIKGVVDRTKQLLEKKISLPNNKASDKELFDYGFFSALIDRAYDKDKKILENIPKERLKYIILAFYYSYQETNFHDLSNLLGQLKTFIDEDKDAKKLYYEGIQREINLYEILFKNEKDKGSKLNLFYRYQLASFNYEFGNIQWVLDFLNQFDDLSIPEKVILADALSDINRYQEAVLIYKDILQENKSIRIIVNCFHNLVMSEKIAEAMLFSHFYKNYASAYEPFQKNDELLQKQKNELKKISFCYLAKEKLPNKSNKQIISLKELKIEEKILDDIMDYFAKENEVIIYKDSAQPKVYYYFKDVEIDLNYFIQ